MERQPMYIKMYASIKNKILDGDYAVGQLLPPEPALEKQYNTSRTTVRRAVELLAREGYVVVQQGKGTEVLDYITMQNLNKISSFSKTLIDKGYEVKSKSTYIDLVLASEFVARGLKLKEAEEVVRVQRVQLSNNQPIAIITNYLPQKIGYSLLTNDDDFVSLYQYIEEHCLINIDSSNDRISAKSASFSEAQMLDVPVGTALISLKRVCYAKKEPVSVDVLKIVGSKYEFEVNLLNLDS